MNELIENANKDVKAHNHTLAEWEAEQLKSESNLARCYLQMWSFIQMHNTDLNKNYLLKGSFWDGFRKGANQAIFMMIGAFICYMTIIILKHFNIK